MVVSYTVEGYFISPVASLAFEASAPAEPTAPHNVSQPNVRVVPEIEALFIPP